MEDFLIPFVEAKHRKHSWQVKALGHQGCIKCRDPEVLLMDSPGSVIGVRDYTDRLSMEHNDSAQSTGMGGGNANLGMEGFPHFTADDLINPNKITMNWHGHMSEEKTQNCKTSFANTCKFIKRMREENELLRDSECVLCIRSDGCQDQCKSANNLHMNILIANSCGITVDWMITAPHHGKNLVDALAGRDKNDLMNALVMGLDSSMADANLKRKTSEAIKAAKHLNARHRWRKNSPDSKHKRKEDANWVENKCWEAVDYDKEGIPLEHCFFQIKKGGFDEGPRLGKDANGVQLKCPENYNNGTTEMFHFRHHPFMPKNTCAVRRVPCPCDNCKAQLKQPWEMDVDPKDQPMFQNMDDCDYSAVMGDLNKWHFLEIEPKKDKANPWGEEQDREVNMIKQDGLTAMESKVSSQVEIGKFGAIDTTDPEAKDGVYIVQWTGEPHCLTEPTLVDGCGEEPMEEGTLVCKGIFWCRVHGAPCWCECPPKNDREETTFWMQHCLDGDLSVLKHSRSNTFNPNIPNGAELSLHVKNYQGIIDDGKLLKVPPHILQEDLYLERKRREKMELVKVTRLEEEEEEEEPEQQENETLTEEETCEGMFAQITHL